MPADRLITRLVIYYAVLAGLVLSVLWLEPALQDNLPIGRTQALLSQSGAPLEGIPRVDVHPGGPLVHVPTFAGSLIWLTAAILGAFLASLPIAWVYMTIRNPRDYDQSLVDTIIVLPIVVTSIVVIVQHSLALAFSLAGVAGAVRFRNNLKSSGDLLFILLAIGIGLACGIGAVELAMLSSAAFNACFVSLWMTSFGERMKMKRFLAEVGPNNNGNDTGKRKAKHKAEKDAPTATAVHDTDNAASAEGEQPRMGHAEEGEQRPTG
ncbi:MAG: DUF4956 domain-containing protein [Thermaurantiacus sp.]